MSGWIVAWLLFCAALALVSGVYYFSREARAEIPFSDDRSRLIRNRIVVYVIVYVIVLSCLGWILYDMSQ